jgi:NADPH:quinone reductase-like Zn-dependent oxidoreductase
MMRAARAHRFGSEEALAIEEIDAPEPGAGQIRIAVRAAGVNPVDWKLLSGKAPVSPPLPFTPGGDVAGVVDAVGPGVEGWSPGDRVFAHPGLMGGYVEAIVLPAAYAAPIPEAVGYDEAAATPLVALTALQGLEADGRNLNGLHVLVHNAAGGVGNAAVQIAKARGARVTASASAAKEAFVKGLGADIVADFRTATLEGRARDVDILMDLVGDSKESGLWALVRDGGSVIRVAGGAAAPAEETVDGVRAYKMRVRPNGEQLREIASLMERRQLRTHVEQRFPLSRVPAALAASKGGRTRGKIVLVVSED